MEINLPAPDIISHNEGMTYPLKTQEALAWPPIDGQGYRDDEIAPLGQNHHMFPQGEQEFLGMDFSEDDAQANEELYQQYQNGSWFFQRQSDMLKYRKTSSEARFCLL